MRSGPPHRVGIATRDGTERGRERTLNAARVAEGSVVARKLVETAPVYRACWRRYRANERDAVSSYGAI